MASFTCTIPTATSPDETATVSEDLNHLEISSRRAKEGLGSNTNECFRCQKPSSLRVGTSCRRGEFEEQEVL
jgi:hypothetical protein